MPLCITAGGNASPRQKLARSYSRQSLKSHLIANDVFNAFKRQSSLMQKNLQN